MTKKLLIERIKMFYEDANTEERIARTKIAKEYWIGKQVAYSHVLSMIER